MKSIWTHAGKGSLEGVKAEIGSGIDINAQDPDGRTALFRAVQADSVDVVEFLLKEGADPNILCGTHFDGGPSALLEACRRNHDVEIVKLLLKAGAETEHRNEFGLTALSVSIDPNNVETVRLLLSAGADPNVNNSGVPMPYEEWDDEQDQMPTTDQPTTLVAAIDSGSVEVVRMLLEFGADPDQPSGRDLSKGGPEAVVTPLMLAAEVCSSEMVKLLLDRGAHAFHAGDASDTALRGSFDLLAVYKLKIQANPPQSWNIARIFSVNSDSQNESFEREQTELEKITNMLLEENCPLGHCGRSLLHLRRYDLLERLDTQSLEEALCYAAYSGNAEWVRYLLELGVNPNTKNLKVVSQIEPAYGRSFFDPAPVPPLLSSQGSSGAISKMMIEAGAEVDWVAPNGITLLDLAAEQGRLETLKILLAYGANVHNGRPLFLAVRNLASLNDQSDVTDWCEQERNIRLTAMGNKPLKLINLLLGKGVDPNRQTAPSDDERYSEGTNVLMIAADAGEKRLVKRLLKAGAKADAQDENGLTAADYASLKGHYEIATLLRKEVGSVLVTSDFSRHVVFAAQNGNFLRIIKCIANGADLETKDERGRTPLLIAVDREDEKLSELLINAGANLEAEWYEGTTAVCLATRRLNLPLVRKLVDAGANVNRKFAPDGPKYFYSPLHFAARMGKKELVKVLLEAGADPNILDYKNEPPIVEAILGRSVYHDGSISDFFEIAEILLQHGAKRRIEDSHHLAILDFPQQSKSETYLRSINEISQVLKLEAKERDDIPGVFMFSGNSELRKRWSKDDDLQTALANCRKRGHYSEWDSVWLYENERRSQVHALCVYPTSDKYVLISVKQIYGLEDEVGCSEIIHWMKNLDKTDPWKLVECGGKSLTVQFVEPPKDCLELAKRIGEFSPNLVDGGYSSLCERLEENKTITFWWD